MKTFRPAFGMGLLMIGSFVGAFAGQDAPSNVFGAGLKDGWQQAIEIPGLREPSGELALLPAKASLWVEEGWLCVRRSAADGALEWQVALAQPIDGVMPAVEIDDANLSITYGQYFVRENRGRLRIMRQRKEAESPAWPTLEMKEAITKRLGLAAIPARHVELKALICGGWCWVISGLAKSRPDVWLRLERQELQKPGFGFEGRSVPPRMFFGQHHAVDEGDLFVATRSCAEISERAIAAERVRKEFGTVPAPAIVASKWFNSAAPLSVEALRGKVVLLDFWGTWCGACIEKLLAIEALHKEYREQGLVVIGVHSEQAGDSVATFLGKQTVSFPIAVDTGMTARNYFVGTWPTYFLIDKAGKLQWGFSSSPPSKTQIEELLR